MQCILPKTKGHSQMVRIQLENVSDFKVRVSTAAQHLQPQCLCHEDKIIVAGCPIKDVTFQVVISEVRYQQIKI